MSYNSEQVIQALINFADNEVMNKLPTTGKWVVGSMVGIASSRSRNIIENLKVNPIVKSLGVIDDDGNIDVDIVISSLRSSAERYGNVTFDVPMVGKMTFGIADIERLRSYF